MVDSANRSSQKSSVHPVDGDGVDLERRQWLSALGGVGALLGANALAACTAPQRLQDSAENTERIAQGLAQLGLSVVLVDTIGTPASPGDLRAPALVPSSGTPTFIVLAKGFWAENDGGGGLFFWSAATPVSQDDTGTIVAPTGRSGTGCWRRLYDGTSRSVRWFGARGNAYDSGASDDSAAFQLAIDSFQSAIPVDGPPSKSGPVLVVPPGAYLAGDIRIDRTMTLIGSGGSGWDNAAWLVAPVGKCGIIVDGTSTCRAAGTPNATSGQFAVIADLRLVGNASALDGIRIYAHSVVVRNVTITNFGGNGISILSSGTVVNCNNWRIEGCRIDTSGGSTPSSASAGGNGIFVTGQNAQAGLCIATDVTQNYWWGVYDNSDLGNCYVAVHFDANGTNFSSSLGYFANGGSVLVDKPTNASTFVGCYSEQDERCDIINSASILLGGQLAAGFGAADKHVPRLHASASRLFFRDDNVRGRYSMYLPDAAAYAETGALFSFRYQQQADLSHTNVTWGLRRFKVGLDSLSEATGASPYNESDYGFDRCWGFQQFDGGDLERVPIGWTDNYHPRGVGHPFFRKPFINNKAHFTLRQTVTVPAGANPLPFVLGTVGWLTPESGASLSASFSLQVDPSVMSSAAAAAVRVGCYAISGNQCTVNLHNTSASAIAVTVVGHFEQYKPWWGSGIY